MILGLVQLTGDDAVEIHSKDGLDFDEIVKTIHLIGDEMFEIYFAPTGIEEPYIGLVFENQRYLRWGVGVTDDRLLDPTEAGLSELRRYLYCKPIQQMLGRNDQLKALGGTMVGKTFNELFQLVRCLAE